MREQLLRYPMFVRLYGRAVHVVDNATTAAYAPDALNDPALDPYLSEAAVLHPLGDGPPDLIGFVSGTTRTRCGREIARHRGGLEASGAFVGTFDDSDLCAQCHRTVRPDDQARLFDHPQESEPEGDGV